MEKTAVVDKELKQEAVPVVKDTTKKVEVVTPKDTLPNKIIAYAVKSAQAGKTLSFTTKELVNKPFICDATSKVLILTSQINNPAIKGIKLIRDKVTSGGKLHQVTNKTVKIEVTYN
jgi:hypothetical protein